MGQNVTITAKDGHQFSAYRADPAGTPRGALVVIQEIFGVNHHIRGLADSFAKQGYVAIAPALFDRTQRDVELGYDPAGIETGRNIMLKVPLEGALADVQAAIDYAKSVGKVGVVGYCWGGSLSFLAATRLQGLSAAVGYYGSLVARNAEERPTVPTILHFGEKDQGIPMTDVEKVKQARPDVPVYVYPAGHGFSCDERGSYDAPSAKLALERTLEFFAKNVG